MLDAASLYTHFAETPTEVFCMLGAHTLHLQGQPPKGCNDGQAFIRHSVQ